VRPAGLLALGLALAAGCAAPEQATLDAAGRRALADSAATLFDSLTAIHTDQPDTALLRRLHPPADTLLFAEGSKSELLTGDSLFRRVLAAHGPVRSMAQRFTDRTAYLLDANHALLTATERVDWLLTIAVSRQGSGWVIRAYRGS
jgi:hypothetical protein